MRYQDWTKESPGVVVFDDDDDDVVGEMSLP
jgi:hypothetical protein